MVGVKVNEGMSSGLTQGCEAVRALPKLHLDYLSMLLSTVIN